MKFSKERGHLHIMCLVSTNSSMFEECKHLLMHFKPLASDRPSTLHGTIALLLIVCFRCGIFVPLSQEVVHLINSARNTKKRQMRPEVKGQELINPIYLYYCNARNAV